MNSDGTNVRQLGQPNDLDNGSPVFTPDGKRLLISRITPTGLYLMNLDGSGARLFKSGALNGRYSADGSKVLFNRPSPTLFGINLYVAAADGSNEKQVPTPSKASAVHASFNPTNSSEIVFTAWDPATTIWVQNVDGTQARSLTQPPLYVDAASYDPSGKQIVYSARQPRPSLQSAIFKRDISGATSQQLVVVPASLVQGISMPIILLPVFSPNGKTISCICGPPAP